MTADCPRHSRPRRPGRCLQFAAMLVMLAWPAAHARVVAAAPQGAALGVAAPDATIKAFFKQHCVQCHGPEKQKADLRLDNLAAPAAGSDKQAKVLRDTWEAIADAIDAGDMPPKKQPRPDADEARRVVRWVAQALSQSTRPMRGLRRLNRAEYEHTLHDLLGINADLADLLPEDGKVQGFDNVAGGLGLSSILMERYLEAADAAFDDVIRRIKPLEPAIRRSELMKNKNNIGAVKGKKGGVLSEHGAYVDFTPGWPPARVDEAHPIEGGVYRIRIAVWPHNPNTHRTLTVAVYLGPLFGPGKRRFMGMFDVTGTPDKPRIIEFTAPMGEDEAISILPWVYPGHVTYRDKHEKRPGVGIVWAETYGPLDQDFPSPSTVKLFGDDFGPRVINMTGRKKNEPKPPPAIDPGKPGGSLFMKEGWPIYMRHRRGVRPATIESKTPAEDAERIIRSFVPRAFRRPVDKSLVDPFVKLALSRLEEGATFEQAIRAGVTAVLSSPHFLLLNAQPTVDDYAIASRLSYFLWSSLPDDELLGLAKAGKLRDRKVLHAQVDRMIADPKIERFIERFTGQWLDLDEIEFTTPSNKLYPEYDEMLLRSMLAETRGFFRHVLQQDLSVMNFVDSDFAVLNKRLAEHYGLNDQLKLTSHEHFKVVKLPKGTEPGRVRGGVMTHASVLKVTANGTTTSPVLRGVWVLDKILGQPAPPPPPGVPAVEPDIRGATSIREQLDKHRSTESCARCHNRIDAPGFAMESFDPIGIYRDRYRVLGDRRKKGKDAPKVDWVRNTQYGLAQTVDTTGSLIDGRTFDGFADFRKYLMEDPDTIARSLATKLLVYGCGRPVTHADDAVVRNVVSAAKKKGLGLRSLIHAVVDSEMFTRP